MAQPEHHFTVFIRMPFKRGDFVDPPPVVWNATKERALWDLLSRVAKNSDTDWKALAEQFEVSERFLLQQAAWLYERNLQQVRAHMRRVGSRQSATPSPAPGSTSASMVGGQAMRRGGSGGSRVPSRLSTQALGSPVGGDGRDSIPGTPAKSRTSFPFRNVSGTGATISSQNRSASGSGRPLSRQSSKDADNTVGYAPTQSRRGSIQQQVTRSTMQGRTSTPQQQVQEQSSGSEEEMTQSRMISRRPNPSSIHRRAVSLRKDLQSQRANTTSSMEQHVASQRPGSNDDDDEDDSPSFLPFATPSPQPSNVEARPRPSSSSQQDPSATLRGGLGQIQTQNQRPGMHRRTTSERVSSPTVEPPTPKADRDIASSTSSLSSPSTQSHPSTVATYATARANQTNVSNTAARQPQGGSRPGLSNPLSPPHRALLPSSPRRHASGAGSDTSPSMGSSFSDLDDASVTQSALEEALLSGMGNTTMTMHGGVAGRVSGISQALRSRYFDSRGNDRGHGVSER